MPEIYPDDKAIFPTNADAKAEMYRIAFISDEEWDEMSIEDRNILIDRYDSLLSRLVDNFRSEFEDIDI